MPDKRGEIGWSRAIAVEPAEDRAHRTGARLQLLVFELLSERECRAGVVELSSEACQPCEAAVDERLQRRPVRRFPQGLFEKVCGPIEALELGQEHERFRAPRPGIRLGKQVGRDRSCARPLSGRLVRAGGGQHPATPLVARVRRGQPDGVLAELGRDGGCAAVRRQARGIVEQGGDLGVRLVPGQRKMARAKERVFHTLGDLPMHAPPPLAKVLIEQRRQQRASEPDRPALALDHVRRHRRFQDLCGNAGAHEH
jgi:hypothetical protein